MTQIELQNFIATAVRDYLQQNAPAITGPNPATNAATLAVSTPQHGNRNQHTNLTIPTTGSQSRGHEPIAALAESVSPMFEAPNAPRVTSPTRSDGSNLPDLSALLSSVR